MIKIFEQARRKALERWNDPHWSTLLWGRREFERQKTLCDFDPWSNGLEGNHTNIERFTLYSYEQGLSRRRWQPHELFVRINDTRH